MPGSTRTRRAPDLPDARAGSSAPRRRARLRFGDESFVLLVRYLRNDRREARVNAGEDALHVETERLQDRDGYDCHRSPSPPGVGNPLAPPPFFAYDWPFTRGG